MAVDGSDERGPELANPDTPNPDTPNHDNPDPVLARAAQELRDEEVPSWVEASAAILATLRATARRTRALDATHPGFADGDTLRVGDHVVMLAVVRAVSDLPCKVKSVDVEAEGRTCTGVSLDIAVPYGADLAPLAEQLGEITAAAVDATLGTTLTADDISVHVVDVVLP